MKLLQINSTANVGSTGKIAEEIGLLVLANNGESYIAYGRKARESKSRLIRIGGQFDFYYHLLVSMIFDKHGYGSKRATLQLVKKIAAIGPDIILLHNIHGYYINFKVLFNYLETSGIPLVWTLHDCWSFTGHCTHYENIECMKWKSQCFSCPKKVKYPKSILMDASRSNYIDKSLIFNRQKNLTLITPCNWLKGQLAESFLKKISSKVIFNGIDLKAFRPILTPAQEWLGNPFPDKKILIGVANVWQESKGLFDFINISKRLSKEYKIVLVGVTESQKNKLPSEIYGILKTHSREELAYWYSIAHIYINPTYLDTFPTTNIEALACGTPVITYNAGGSPEAIDETTGRVVQKGDIEGLLSAINSLAMQDRETLRIKCRQRAESLFDKEDRFLDYIFLFREILGLTQKA